jgi:hypothetical protein
MNQVRVPDVVEASIKPEEFEGAGILQSKLLFLLGQFCQPLSYGVFLAFHDLDVTCATPVVLFLCEILLVVHERADLIANVGITLVIAGVLIRVMKYERG